MERSVATVMQYTFKLRAVGNSSIRLALASKLFFYILFCIYKTNPCCITISFALWKQF